jgi:prephenate dehydratase
MPTVSIQGVAGAYSEEAVRQYFGPETETLPCRTFSELFATVEQRGADYGMLPIENSLAGSVVQSYELLMEHDLRVRAEVILRVSATWPAGGWRRCPTLTRRGARATWPRTLSRAPA